jgi:amino acid adenylation domain-containing protein
VRQSEGIIEGEFVTGLDADTACLSDLVQASGKTTSQAVAITLGCTSVSYSELLDRARLIAQRLAQAGARPDSFVGVTIDRSIDAVLGIMGVVMTGAAYIPLAGNWPRERIRIIAEDAAIGVITGTQRPAGVPGIEWVPVDAGAAETAREGFRVLQAEPDNTAYAIFTSGSTGRPKGVVVSHRAVLNSTLGRFGIYPHRDVTYLMLAPLTIDAAAAGLYFTLAAGGRIVIPTAEEVLDSDLLADLIVRERVTHLDGLPSQYAPLLKFYAEPLANLRCVILGGEAMPAVLVDQHLSLLPHVLLYNEYGPTEGTIWSTCYHCHETRGNGPVPIGLPAPGVRARVLDGDLHAVPAGKIGEIYISGTGLARSYLHDPSMTAARFVADPDPRYPGERMYRTGDLGSVAPDGKLICHGRTDCLVKVRGFRVELGEVEARLLECPDLMGAVVVPHESITGTRLVAIIAVQPGRRVDVRTLASFAAARLPAYMVPSLWRQVNEFPVTDNGKVDRRILQAQATTVGSAIATESRVV